MLFGEQTVSCCENHRKQTNTLGGEKAEFQYVKAGGI
jgi:hypothetical protein